MAKNRTIKILSLFLILLILLSCSISFADSSGKGEGDDIESMRLELTRQALQLTQAAISNSGGGQGSGQSGGQPSTSGGQSGSSQDGEQSNGQDSEEEEEEDETPCNDSHIIGETVKDGTVFDPGEAFEKTWTLRNEGDCDWTTDYDFKFIEGSRMGGASNISVPSVIEPWEDITFKVNLTAPDNPGDYTGVWQLFADDGEKMGRY